MSQRTRINHQIQATELRIIGPEGENFGVLSLSDALKKAEELGEDLIEISPNASPPVGKIMNYGKFQYMENKKSRESKTKSRVVEIKNIQIKIGTGEHDLTLKAKKTSEWLREGNRIKIDLFLPGRSKYLDQKFLKERMDRFLNLVSEDFKMPNSPQKSPKGLTVLIERGKQTT